MIHVSRTFFVRADPKQALAYLEDFSNAVEWDPGTQRCERIDSGKIAVGSHWHNESKLIVFPAKLEYRLLERTPTRVLFRGENDSAVSFDDIQVVPEGLGARVTYDARVTLSGLAKLSEPVMQLIFLKLARDTVKQLTAALEAL